MDDDKPEGVQEQNGHGTPTEDTKAYWEKEKARLEAEKLEAESKNYPRRLELEDKKLESDVRDWYFKSLVVIITSIASVAGFFIGKFYERSSDANKQRFELTLQRDREENEDFSKNLALLSSANVGQRAVAAVALRHYVQSASALIKTDATVSDHGFRFGRLVIGRLDDDSAVEKVVRERDEQRVDQVLRTVSARLPSETDSLILEEYSGLLVAVPGRALPYAVSINRRAGSQLARSAADYVAWSFHDPARFQHQGCQFDSENSHNLANQKEVNQKLDELKELGVRTPMPFEGDVPAGDPASPTFHLLPLIQSSLLDEKFQRECRRVVTLSSQMKESQRVDERSKSRDDLDRAIRVISVSSLTLNRILQQLSGKVAGQDLSGTYMVNGRLDNLDLSKATLASSYLAGQSRYFSCRGCDFSSADLSQLSLLPPFDVTGLKFQGLTSTGALKAYLSTLPK